MTDNMAEQARMAWVRMFKELSVFKARVLCEQVAKTWTDSDKLISEYVHWQLSMIEEYRFLFGASYKCELAVPDPKWTKEDEAARIAAEEARMTGRSILREAHQQAPELDPALVRGSAAPGGAL